MLVVLGAGIWIGVQHLGYLEFGELARVAHRTLDQPQIFVNNLAIRRAIEEFKVARDYDQVRRILTAAFGSNDFDSFELQCELLPGEVLPFELPDSSAARHVAHAFRWNKAGVPKMLDRSTVWTLSLNLVSSSNQRRGTLTIHRLYSSRDLQLDINLLTSAFPSALADALDRTLAHSAAVIPLAHDDTSLITAQAG